MRTKLLLTLAALVSATTAMSKVRMPQLFQSGMVLQRGVEISVWGWADAGETVTVTLGRRHATATAGSDGRWAVELPPVKAGGPYTLTVNDDVRLDDVLVGDVWLCSGQSNMETTVERVYPQYEQEIDTWQSSQVRLLHVPNVTNTHGQSDDLPPCQWQQADRQTAWRFSALGYFLGRRMLQETGVPQGIIESAWGGTPIEAWIAADTLAAYDPLLLKRLQLVQDDDFVAAQQRANQLANSQWQRVLDQSDPGVAQAWTAADTDDSQWDTVDQWGQLGVTSPTLTGTLYLRQHIYIDKVHAGAPAKLLLGTLYDCDYTYVNGQEVGRTYYQYPPRRYTIPEGLLHEGDNVVCVRFVNKYGKPYFYRDKDYKLVFADGTQQPLGTQWRARVGTTMPPQLGAGLDIHYAPSVLYNAMVCPLAPLRLAGCVWYQGESNTGNADDYAPLLRRLMANWRSLFKQPQMPFAIVQLANYMAPTTQPQESGWPRVREAQRTVAEADAWAEAVVNIDLGETSDIHPLRKKEVAERTALCLDRLVYGKQVALFPKVTGAAVQAADTGADGSDSKATVVLTLDQPLAADGPLDFFEMAGADGRFVNVGATAAGSVITLQAPMSQPVAVRYAWRDNPLGASAYSRQGLPLGPFELRLTP